MAFQSQPSISQFMNQRRDQWDPEATTGVSIKPSSAIRIKNDLNNIYKDPVPGIFVLPDNLDLSKINALITGPFDTPYEGGFFYFIIGCPGDYPLKPPKVKLKTTGFGTVRFNPNFYKNGKVCLSILGTWSGPEWTPAQNLSSVLISIQSLFNDKPYFNEPGFSKESHPGDSNRYNTIIQHETIRCAVCDVMETKMEIPVDFQAIVESTFPDYFDYYKGVCWANKSLDGQQMCDPFGERRGNFGFGDLLKRLETIKVNLDDKYSEIPRTVEPADSSTVGPATPDIRAAGQQANENELCSIPNEAADFQSAVPESGDTRHT